MKPSARMESYRRRLIAALALCPVVAGAAGTGNATDQACRIPTTSDPRLDALRQADPNDPHIDITSDHGDMSRAGDALLSGDVTIRMGQRLLSAEQATIDSTNRSITVQGKVEYLDPTIHVTGHEGDYAGTTGHFEGAHFELVDGSGRGAARSATLTDQNVLDLEGVRYTVCPPGNEDWLIHAQNISLNQATSTGTARDVRLDFMGVPILYAPWLSFPVGDQRKTGLLFPAFGSGGQSGAQIVVPWYWNMAPNYDSTLTTRWFSSRGFRFDPEFRYLTEQSHGALNAQWLPHDSQRGDSRGFYEFKDSTVFAPQTRLLANASYVTDNSYFEDFGSGIEGTSVIFLKQEAEIRSETEHWSVLGRAQNFQVIDNDLAPDERPYSMLPQLVVAGTWDRLWKGFGAAIDGEAVNFYRTTGPTGVRVDTEPSVSWDMGNTGAYVNAKAAWRYTAYALADTAPGTDQSPARSLPVLSVDSGFVLERPTGARQQGVQTLEPRVQYVYIPYRNQDDIPVFDTDQPTLNMVELFRTNRYVGADRVGDANMLATGLTTRMLDAANGQQYLSATIGQAYFFENPRVTLPGEAPTNRSTSNVIAEVELDAFRSWNGRFAYQWDPDKNRSERTEFGVQYRPAGDSVINATYRYQRNLLEQVDFSTAWPIAKQWHGFARWVYSLSENKTLDQFAGFEYQSCCWALRLITRHFVNSRTGSSTTSIGFELELKGLSSVGVDNQSFLRDAIHGYSPLPDEPAT
jgi:LPS-assembly protein